MAVYIAAEADPKLAERLWGLIERLREDPKSVPRKEVVDVIVDLTKASFDYHFVSPLDDLGVGFTTKTTIQVSLASMMKILRGVVQKVVGSMSEQGYGKLADYLERAYFELE
ncbi:hypothetical protein FOS14_20035 [Skermania sp. ID1734]|uniref:hypothetical protein n=1 Tax=Skermania sp. ID1734 TaxID=2597516 RepID=UPI00117C5727|nr:hypothetical protein [Skermania sp. ID1734]TSD94602.1 hypothetical protein FOS14_20035 [Skermania sp. ID1734]